MHFTAFQERQRKGRYCRALIYKTAKAFKQAAAVLLHKIPTSKPLDFFLTIRGSVHFTVRIYSACIIFLKSSPEIFSFSKSSLATL